MSTQERMHMQQEGGNNDMETCPNCGTRYRVLVLREGDDWNDFGYRYCLFCGMLTDEYAHLKPQ